MGDITTARLRVVICGAGIAGLAAAAALATCHQVTVLERKEELQEVAYAINLKPNAAHAAYGVVGLDAKNLQGLPCREFVERDGSSGHIKMAKPVDAVADYGGPWYFCQRTELHAALLAKARHRGVKINLGCEVKDVDVDAGIVYNSSGVSMAADLILVADGIGSRLRKTILEDDNDHRWDSGQVAYRAFVPAARFSEEPELQWLAEQKAGGLYVWAAQKQRMVVYPCPGYVNIVAIVDKDHLQRYDDGIIRFGRASNKQMADDMRCQFADFEPLARKLLDRAEEASLWPLLDVSPLPHYQRGCALLIGDAAHATLPHQGQGASLAFEDAEGLAHLFCSDSAGVNTARDVAALLDQFTTLRKERVHMVQRVSRIMAKPANYDKGEKLDLMRFAAKTLTYRGIASLQSE